MVKKATEPVKKALLKSEPSITPDYVYIFICCDFFDLYTKEKEVKNKKMIPKIDIRIKAGIFLILFGGLMTYLHYQLNLSLIPIGYFIMIGCGAVLILHYIFIKESRADSKTL